jgi:hypothetical protein
MPKYEIEITKLKSILNERGLTQLDLYDLIKEVNDGKVVQLYILNEIINGKRKNFTINTAILIANALELPIDDIID